MPKRREAADIRSLLMGIAIHCVAASVAAAQEHPSLSHQLAPRRALPRRLPAVGQEVAPIETELCAAELSSRPLHLKTIAARESTQGAEANSAAAPDPQPLEWWRERAREAVWQGEPAIAVDLDTLLVDTLLHSPRILGVGLETQVALAEVVIADAAFDPLALVGTRAGRTSDPVGNTLVTGGPPRSREASWNSQMGLRKTTRSGARWDVSQQLGLLDSNSVFFSPPNQGNARLSVSLSQPLLAGAGRLYNERLLLQARIEGDAAWHHMHGEVQEQIANVMISYWRLYEHRCRLLQQRDLLERGLQIERIVEGRSELDTGRVELLRAREQVARRRDRLIRVEADLRNEQTRLAMWVGSPALAAAASHEWIPQVPQPWIQEPVGLREALATGLEHRPEIHLAAAQLENARLQVAVTRNQLLPQLNALLETYLAGLNGNRDAFGSLADQFSEGEPGFAAGLQMELPVGRRAAHAKHRAARSQMLRETEALREAVLNSRAEIETAVREVSVAIAETDARCRAAEAARAEEEYLRRRWEVLAGDGGAVGLVLQDLLDSQTRRTDAEELLVAARVGYRIALIRLQTAMGTLLTTERIDAVEDDPEFGIRYHRHNPQGISEEGGESLSE